MVESRENKTRKGRSTRRALIDKSSLAWLTSDDSAKLVNYACIGAGYPTKHIKYDCRRNALVYKFKC